MRDCLVVGMAWQTTASDNLGVCALAESNMAIAQRAAQRAGKNIRFVEFCPANVVEVNPHRDFEITRADSMSVKRLVLGKSRYLQDLRECDFVLDIGQGDSFSDIYGERRFLYLALSKALALVAKRVLVLSPQTIGPFERKWVRMLSAFLMRRAGRVFARDALSMEYLHAQGLGKGSEQVTDVAFRLPFTRAMLEPTSKVRVGVNVSGLLYNGGYTRNNQFGLRLDYKLFVQELLQRLTAEPDIETHLIAHVLSEDMPVEDDYQVLLDLKRTYPNVVIAPRFASASSAKGYIAGMDFFTGARMHACIAAFSAGVPVVPQAYSRKFNGLFRSLGYEHLADLKADDCEQALSKILAGISSRVVLRAEVARGNVVAQELLERYEDYLASLFGGARADHNR